MPNTQPHLELRNTGFYWRRRVPARVSNRFIPAFFCFPLRTQVLREAAELARRLTTISELCFNAETNVRPEIMTSILVDYSRFEIDGFDHLRALTGPRTRQAAEAALEIEAAARASLRDSIFLCDHAPALPPIHDTARRLGIEIDENDEDFPILTAKMVRLMVEISDEKDRRARGLFFDRQPYLQMSLQIPQDVSTPLRSPEKASPTPLSCEVKELPNQPAQTDMTPLNVTKETSAEVSAEKEKQKEKPFFEREGLEVGVSAENYTPALVLDGSRGGVLDLWDAWFDAKKQGSRRNGVYTVKDDALAKKFMKNAGTVQSTRKLISDIFGNKPISSVTYDDWKSFNDMLFMLPKSHGKSPRHKEQHCFEIIEQAKKDAARELRKVKTKIEKERLSEDQSEELLEKTRLKTLAPRTVQRHQGYLNTALNHAVENGVISHNPYKPFVLNEKLIDELRNARPETSRQLWLDEFQELLGKEKWTSKNTEIDDPIYWLPIISRLQGLRSEEILQLKPENIRSDQGVWFFDIERGTGQSSKSNNARRFVPIHCQLIELGFLELVELQRSRRKQRIFARVNRSKCSKKNYTALFTKNFTYFRKSHDIYEKRRDFHALRTTFNSKMVGLAIPDTARRYMMGHKNADVGIVNYLPEGFPIKTLKALIELDRIDISMVTRRFRDVEEKKRRPYLAVDDGVEIVNRSTA